MHLFFDYSPLIYVTLAKLWVYFSFAGIVWYHFRLPGGKLPRLHETFWRRFFALLVDAAVLSPFGVACSFLDEWPRGQGKPFAIAVLALPSGVAFAYSVVMHARYGQTVGKMACRVKVVDAASGGRITFRQALAREGIYWMRVLPTVGWALYKIASDRANLENISDTPHLETGYWLTFIAAVAWFMIDFFVCLQSKNYRALHDFIAGTIPVNVDALEESGATFNEPAPIID